MARVTRMWKLWRASVYRSLKDTPPNKIATLLWIRLGACSDAELAEHIRQHIAASRLHRPGETMRVMGVVPSHVRKAR